MQELHVLLLFSDGFKFELNAYLWKKGEHNKKGLHFFEMSSVTRRLSPNFTYTHTHTIKIY